MMITKQRNPISLLILLILTAFSFARFVSSFLSNCNKHGSTAITTPAITTKELEYKSTIVAKQAGHPATSSYSASTHTTSSSRSSTKAAGGTTVFILDKKEAAGIFIKSGMGTSQIHQVGYHIRATDAYKVLREARENPECVQKGVPMEILEKRWDVVKQQAGWKLYTWRV